MINVREINCVWFHFQASESNYLKEYWSPTRNTYLTLYYLLTAFILSFSEDLALD